MTELVLLFLGGLIAGALGGLLGIGGGIILMPLLRFIVGLSPSHSAGTCILAVFFTTLGGSYRHYKLGHVKLRPLFPLIISGAVATAIFSFVFQCLSAHESWLDLGIGLVFSLISVRMILEGIPGLFMKKDGELAGNEIKGTLTQKVSVGSIAGILPGLLGIGTGVILVPTFTFILGTSIKIAVASSLTCFCFNAFISSAFKIMQGFIELNIALPICAGTLLGANLGAIMNKRFPPNTLKLIFGLLFSYVSLKFILSFYGVKI
ncbi:sulfite exporter TauE/SafE family protein [Planctomycetota bacterium]